MYVYICMNTITFIWFDMQAGLWVHNLHIRILFLHHV